MTTAMRHFYRLTRSDYRKALLFDAQRWPDPIPVYPEEPNP